MRNIFTILAIVISSLTYLEAQVYPGVGGTIQNNGQETYFTLPVSGLNPSQIDSVFGLEEVCITINHPSVSELYIYLQSPSGTIVELSDGAECTGTNYSVTCFNNGVNNSITLGTAPYNGTFKPVGYLGRFNTGQPGNGTWKLMVKDYLAFVNSGTLVSWSLKFSNAPSKPVVFKSSNLPIVFINTNNQTIGDTKISVSMGIIDNGSSRNYATDPWNGYNAKAVIHLRGNSTKNLEKKSYSFETRDNTGSKLNISLLGMPAESDWNLVAYYQDKSLVRIPLTNHLFEQMGHYAPRWRNVEVVLNGEYQGVYALMEKASRNTNRINIDKVTPTDNSFPYITGGYIFKIDRAQEPGWASLLPGSGTTNHFFYQYVYPTDSNITSQQKNYIKTAIDTFETVMNSPGYPNLTTGYPKYIDVGSFVDFFIINELSKNVDSYRLSTYMYKDNSLKGNKIHIGPVWDYDLGFHNCNYANTFDPNYWQYQIQDTTIPTPNWWNKFMLDSNFVNQVYCRWHSLRQNILSTNYLNNFIDSLSNRLNESQARNFTQWPVLGAYLYPNPQSQLNATYLSEVADLKNWIASRAAWLDNNIVGHCIAAGIGNNYLKSNSITVFPNPFDKEVTFSIVLDQASTISLKLFDAVGNELESISPAKSPGGIFTITIANKYPKGMFFYRLTVNNSVYTGKIIN